MSALCNNTYLADEDIFRCENGGLPVNYGFAINPKGAMNQVAVHKLVDIAPSEQFVQTTNNATYLVAAGGGNSLIAAGGGNLIAAGGGNVESSLIAAGGGNLIAAGAGNLVAQGGGNLVAQGGGNLIAAGGGNIAPRAGMSSNYSGASSADGAPVHVESSSDLSTTKGWFIVRSSSGTLPTYTAVTNPNDGSVMGALDVNFDSTSSPRASDLAGLAFATVFNPAIIQFENNNVTVDEGAGRATITVTRTGDPGPAVTLNYATSDDTANERTDYMHSFGSLTFASGETRKDITIPLVDNSYAATGPRSFHLTIGNVIGAAVMMPNIAVVTITNNDATDAASNPADNSRFFVREQYLDFFGREPDQAGWDFWTNNIESCGANAGCREAKRIDTSAAFFLSIEFQQTGYLVYRYKKESFGSALTIPRYADFLADTQRLDKGVIVGAAGWEAQLETNKQDYTHSWVLRHDFVEQFPIGDSAAHYVDTLFANSQAVPTAAERSSAITAYGVGDVAGRMAALRNIAESASVSNGQFNRAFVLMQYFGYLRRNPDDAPDANFDGFNFWLGKLNSFGGDFRKADMVKSFLLASEYRQRFGR